MARLLPEADDAELSTWSSAAERRVYLACRLLPAHWLIVRGIRTLARNDRGVPRDGEADFTLFDPARGLLCIEVKGGTIRYDGERDKWFGRDEAGGTVWRTDPFLQAMKRKKDLVRMLTEASAWRSASLGVLPEAHAVLFPDLDDLPAIDRPDAPPEIVGGRRDLIDLEGWIDRVFAYWAVHRFRAQAFPPGATAVVERLLAGSFMVEPRLGVRIEQEAEQRCFWTDRQWEIVRSWSAFDRIVIRGGAGTGKTVLAVRRAQQLAEEGRRVALLCFNKPLADLLRLENLRYTRAGGAAEDLLETMSFHSFARYWVDEVRMRTGRDHLADARRLHPGKDEDRVQLPMALGWALDDARPDYDAILVDEGQDFGDVDWNAIETLASGRRLVVFYDPNQAVFRTTRTFPTGDAPVFELVRNCRNTGAIHDAAYTHYRGPPDVGRPAMVGVPVRRWDAPTLDEQAARIAAGVEALVADEGVAPHDIVVLLFDARRKKQHYPLLEAAFAARRVPFVRQVHGTRGSVLLETAGRFKGLEAAVVVLWTNGALPEEERRKFLYVAQSRARSVLVVVGVGG